MSLTHTLEKLNVLRVEPKPYARSKNPLDQEWVPSWENYIDNATEPEPE